MSDGMLSVSKLEAAKRQLDCAIELWFLDKDPVCIHALAHAAHDIVHAVNRNRTGKEILFDSSVIVDEHRSEVINLFKKPGNFFKHADKDPNGVIEFHPLGAMLFMLAS